jgi:hypothetical protein
MSESTGSASRRAVLPLPETLAPGQGGAPHGRISMSSQDRLLAWRLAHGRLNCAGGAVDYVHGVHGTAVDEY